MTTQAKYLVIAAVVALALGAGALLYFTPPAVAPGPGENISTSTPSTPPVGTPTTTGPTAPPTTTPPTTPPPTPPAPTSYTMAQVALHASASSCWTVIRGSVYDLTTWISQHPGGEQAILQLCGTDGTDEFVGQHGGSPQQENKLATFKIGVLAQ